MKKMVLCFSNNPNLSESRRSFLLLIIFDFTFMILLWLIYVTTKGYSLKEAYENEIVHYDANLSLADVVLLAIIRFLIYSIIYVAVRLVHWIPVSLLTFISSTFLISKVVLFAIKGTHKLLTDYLVLILSFVIVWIEIWYLEAKIFSEARKSQNTHQTDNAASLNVNQDRIGVNYGAMNRHAFSEIGSFYSPLASVHNSDDDEENEKKDDTEKLLNNQLPSQDLSNLSFNSQAKEYEKQSKDLIQTILDIYNKRDGWKMEKVMHEDETHTTCVQSQSFSKIGKVFKLESTLKSKVDAILKVLRDEIEKFPEWNKDVRLTKVLNKFPNNMFVVYSAVYDHAGGLVSARDFVNLSKYTYENELHIIAAKNTTHVEMPNQEGYVRGENGPTGYLLKEAQGECKITWILNVNLKGWLPQYLIDQSLSSVQLDFIELLRKRLAEKTC